MSINSPLSIPQIVRNGEIVPPTNEGLAEGTDVEIAAVFDERGKLTGCAE